MKKGCKKTIDIFLQPFLAEINLPLFGCAATAFTAAALHVVVADGAGCLLHAGFISKSDYRYCMQRFGVSVSYRIGELRASVKKAASVVEDWFMYFLKKLLANAERVRRLSRKDLFTLRL